MTHILAGVIYAGTLHLLWNGFLPSETYQFMPENQLLATITTITIMITGTVLMFKTTHKKSM
jgi:hypothetical protein